MYSTEDRNTDKTYRGAQAQRRNQMQRRKRWWAVTAGSAARVMAVCISCSGSCSSESTMPICNASVGLKNSPVRMQH